MTGWWFGFFSPIYWESSSSQRTNIFQRGWNHQPDDILENIYTHDTSLLVAWLYHGCRLAMRAKAHVLQGHPSSVFFFFCEGKHQTYQNGWSSFWKYGRIWDGPWFRFFLFQGNLQNSPNRLGGKYPTVSVKMLLNILPLITVTSHGISTLIGDATYPHHIFAPGGSGGGDH